jgi:glycerol uptake facilitator-like aquaporin
MSKFYSEFIGVFFLIVAIGLTANVIAVGIILAALVYFASDLSGGHFNPAISIAAWIADEINTKQFIRYISAQCLGALLGSFLVWWLSGTTYSIQPDQSTSTVAFITVEFLFTLLFVLVFLFMMYPVRKRRNPAYGLVVGFTFAACLVITDPITGTGLNPVLSAAFIFTDFINHGYSYYYLLVYILSPLLGGLGAVYIYKKLAIPGAT